VAEQFEEPPYRCSYCDSDWEYVSAMFACELRCAQDRGRE
jgi:hypothetical protein